MIKKLIDTYMDPECIQCVEGGIDVNIAVNKLPLDMICFTGSTHVGKIIAKTAAENLTPCLLELGGKCPAVIDYNATLPFTAMKLAGTKTANAGQICIAPDYVFVHESRVKEFIKTTQEYWKE